MWVTEMEGEVESDLSVFHRVDDMSAMGSRRWAGMVPRLFAYSGAVQLRWKVLAREYEQSDPQSVPGVAQYAGGGGVAASEPLTAPDGTILLPGPPSPMQGGTMVEATPTALQFSEIGDMFSFSQV